MGSPLMLHNKRPDFWDWLFIVVVALLLIIIVVGCTVHKTLHENIIHSDSVTVDNKIVKVDSITHTETVDSEKKVTTITEVPIFIDSSIEVINADDFLPKNKIIIKGKRLFFVPNIKIVETGNKIIKADNKTNRITVDDHSADIKKSIKIIDKVVDKKGITFSLWWLLLLLLIPFLFKSFRKLLKLPI